MYIFGKVHKFIMRIAKYLFLLFILIAVAISVFIVTQPSTFTFTQNETIASNTLQSYSTISDFSTWKSWFQTFNNSNHLKNDSLRLVWDNNGELIKKGEFPNDSIFFEINETDFKGITQFNFTSENDSTQVSWKISGIMSTKLKFLSF